MEFASPDKFNGQMRQFNNFEPFSKILFNRRFIGEMINRTLLTTDTKSYAVP